ncbi:MAG: hypothetical protein M3275_11825, partial [Thermoproteota archaeon]|nr:hypothetical protein [Thermoproteota archaeon]
MTDSDPGNQHADSGKMDTPSLASDELYSSQSHGMDYFTVDGVVRRTGYERKRDWYLLLIKETFDNALDFLWDKSKGGNNFKKEIETWITIDNSQFHYKVRNTNPRPDEFKVFENLDNILDFEKRYGSKQNEHKITRGILGDALKQIAAFPYVLLHAEDVGSFKDDQWNKPIIFRANGIERRVLIRVDKANNRVERQIITSTTPAYGNNKKLLLLSHTDTEIEATFPMINEVHKSLNLNVIAKYLQEYTAYTHDVSFKIHLLDNRDGTKEEIDIPAAVDSSISKEWSNLSSIHYCTPEQFRSRLLGIHDKKAKTVYDVLIRFREATQVSPKRADVNMPIADFMKDPQVDKKIASLYFELREKLGPPRELSLPYSNAKDRRERLVSRIVRYHKFGAIYDASKAVYKILDGIVGMDVKTTLPDDRNTRTTVKVQYPYAIEIIAIPMKKDLLTPETATAYKSEILCAVNYSVSPKANELNYTYGWKYKADDPSDPIWVRNISDLIRAYG